MGWSDKSFTKIRVHVTPLLVRVLGEERGPRSEEREGGKEVHKGHHPVADVFIE